MKKRNQRMVVHTYVKSTTAKKYTLLLGRTGFYGGVENELTILCTINIIN